MPPLVSDSESERDGPAATEEKERGESRETPQEEREGVAAAASAPTGTMSPYWCHMCQSQFSGRDDVAAAPACPRCGGDFVELIANDDGDDPRNFFSEFADDDEYEDDENYVEDGHHDDDDDDDDDDEYEDVDDDEDDDEVDEEDGDRDHTSDDHGDHVAASSDGQGAGEGSAGGRRRRHSPSLPSDWAGANDGQADAETAGTRARNQRRNPRGRGRGGFGRDPGLGSTEDIISMIANAMRQAMGPTATAATAAANDGPSAGSAGSAGSGRGQGRGYFMYGGIGGNGPFFYSSGPLSNTGTGSGLSGNDVIFDDLPFPFGQGGPRNAPSNRAEPADSAGEATNAEGDAPPDGEGSQNNSNAGNGSGPNGIADAIDAIQQLLNVSGVPLDARSVFNIVGNPGDYVFGQQNLDAVITQLMEQNPERTGPPPASEETIANLSRIKIRGKDLDQPMCPVCHEDFTENPDGEFAVRLSCAHHFHPECIGNWLKVNGTCPVCRKTVGTETTVEDVD